MHKLCANREAELPLLWDILIMSVRKFLSSSLLQSFGGGITGRIGWTGGIPSIVESFSKLSFIILVYELSFSLMLLLTSWHMFSHPVVKTVPVLARQ